MRLSTILKGFLPVFISLSFLSFGNEAQAGQTEVPPIEWEQALGQGEARALQEIVGGGYVVTGWLPGKGDSGSDIFLIKTDVYGNKVWEKTFHGNGYSCGFSVKKTRDRGYILAGDTKAKKGYDHDVYVIKTDACGNLLWQRTFGGEHCDYAWSVEQTPDGGYILAGGTESYGNGLYDVYLIKLDSQGNKEWEKTYGGKGSDCGYALLREADGGFLIAGTTEDLREKSNDVYLVRTDAQGELLWEKTFGGQGSDYAWDLERSNDGGYLLVGEKEFSTNNGGGYRLYLLKLDNEANQEWEETYDKNRCSSGYALCRAGNGYFVAGKKELEQGGYEAWILKVDSEGNLEWEKSAGEDCSSAYDLHCAKDGGIAITGSRKTSASADIYLLKLQGNSAMPEVYCQLLVIAVMVPLVLVLFVFSQKRLCQDRQNNNNL